ncbi:MAG: proton-conducting transporter membrane subunit [Geothrix sp.]|nr:proton-conducting transporter membrane subunit [Geothrix sp.]
MSLYLLAILLAMSSGFPGLFLRRRGGEVAAALMGLGAVIGLWAAIRVLAGGPVPTLVLPPAPMATAGLLTLDPIAAFFAIPVFLLPACAAVYGIGYWDNHQENARTLRLVLGLLAASLGLLIASTHALPFLLGWEGMAITAFVLVMTEDRRLEARRAGWIYLVCTHTGTLALFGVFALLFAASGHWAFVELPRGFAASSRGSALFVLCLFAFGFKAGVMPLHFWLPSTHAAAPSHISAVMSGVMIKMGILGLVRLLAWIPDPPFWWGAVLVALGALSGILGVAFALGQHDLKRLLAYHSIENIGIILLGLGLGLLGKSTGHPVIQVLGFAGALLHVLNHSLFKGLLFLAAGSVVHAVGTRDLERMGGLGRRMPWTSAAFLAGSWAISGLPPLNGFVSEWFIYLGAFRALGYFRWPWTLAILTALALIGALAAACFAKAYGTVFQGSPRTEGAAAARESPRSLLAPMGVLAGLCALIGLAPMLLAPALDRVVAAMSGGTPVQPLSRLAHLPSLSLLALALLGSALLLWRWLRPLDPRGSLPTWDCGYAAASPRMQYTASSFADGLVGGLRWVLWPRSHGGQVTGCFPVDRPYESHVPDLVLDRLADPAFRSLSGGATLLRFFQGGKVHIYLLYVLLTLLTLLLWMVA